jgi:hypothetical protein
LIVNVILLLLLRKLIKLINENSKINKLLFGWGALALRVALQIIIILFELNDFLLVKIQDREIKYDLEFLEINLINCHNIIIIIITNFNQIL